MEKMSSTCVKTNSLGEEIRKLEPSKVDDYLEKYDRLVEKKGVLATSLARNQVNLEKNKTQIIKRLLYFIGSVASRCAIG